MITCELLTIERVERAVGYGRAAIYQRIREGSFPKPVKDGRNSRWPSTEIQAWIDNRIAEGQQANQ
ncbi:Predicted transcriptional regulator [Serratia quinivorans]|uniref:helix-turn-helix transcriptional regulator n=1 Tax=Serratia quinivorans TaxID=137545 RepID=UPI002179EEEB|nr:Predicted transcriptional regulator [Serratia quinivorans]CAI0926494.1 Predicted transcriptional regulator [Serratia quinivorans]CAI1715438.1 Predicted transcriptional regulator [Serratia quinivorans]CAI2089979.1 Predicted transcriptional regulator [Serratia quinivorans]CAI2455243.1 Predicted transcriptional regulator [Serratia quinivorans]